MIFTPAGAGEIEPDGSLAMKFEFYRDIPGEVVIEGRRLDAPAPRMPEVVLRGKADGYHETGFEPTTLVFPSEGCWEVTARVKDASLTFVILVVKVPYDPYDDAWLPEGLIDQGPDLTGLPQSFRNIYKFPEGGKGEVIVETNVSPQEDLSGVPEIARQPVAVHRLPGVCVQGALDAGGQWQAGEDASFLEWMVGITRYRIIQAGLGLSCEDLLHIAGR